MVEFVIKSNGQKEAYQKEKVIRSLRRLNLNQEKIEEVLLEICRKLPSVVSTKKLSDFIFSYLKEKKPTFSYKYNLKQAIFKLGPAGYPFEKFIAHLLKLYDYQTKHNLFLKGKCLTYEIDLLAEKDNITYIGECKFHQHAWKVNDVKVVQYSYARFLDLQKENEYPWVITNTRFTSEAYKFAECYSVKLLSWNFPEENLPYLIDNKKAYPLTIFDFLPLKALQNFFNYDIVLIQDFINKDKSYLKKISGLDEMTIQKIFDIINNILGELTS
jgi:hypothetical protein